MSNRLDMGNEYEESYQTREGKKFRGYLMDEASIPMWQMGKGEHFFDIIPYQVGTLDPRVRLGSKKVGNWVYRLDFFVHNKIGISDLAHICLKDTYMTPCPVHEEIEILKRSKDFDEKALKALYSKRRVMYFVWVHDTPEEERKGVQVLDISHFHMEQKLIKIAKQRRGGGFVPFADPEDGRTICVERTGVGATSTNYEGYRFEPREKPIPEEILKHGLSIDSYLYVPSYEEIKRLMQGGSPVNSSAGEEYEEDVPDNPSGISNRVPRSYESPAPVGNRDRCYGGGTFGVSFRKTGSCGDCGVYPECAEEANKLEVAGVK